jgi:hypothetical protein
VLGRPIRANEYPHKVPALLSAARARLAGGDDQPLPESLHNWIARALQLDLRQGFISATEAQIGLEEALSEDTGFVAAPVALETFLSRYISALLEPAAVSPVPAPPAAFEAAMPPVEPPKTIVEPQRPIIELPRAILEPPRPAVEQRPAPVEPARSFVEPSKPLADPPAPRDITELLRDFDLPAVQKTAEMPVHEPAVERSAMSPRKKLIAVAAVALVALVGGGVYAWRVLQKPAAVPMGTLAVQTNPPGVGVFVDGEAHGNTPARVSLKAGSHILELRGRGVPRVIPVTVTANAEVSQYLELPQTPTLGSLIVQSDPAGAEVTVDGVARGKAPVSVADLTPGEHEVVLQGTGGAPVHQKVAIQAGVTASVLTPVSTAAPGPVSGWIAVKSAVSIEVREGGKLLGTTDADRIMLASGRHDLELANDTLGYHATRSIQVPPGKVASITVDLPEGVVNLNASPWAEVWIDGRRVGETPIGNLPVSIGPHEIVFRHPQLGEKRQAVSVTLNAPVRVSVDMK